MNVPGKQYIKKLLSLRRTYQELQRLKKRDRRQLHYYQQHPVKPTVINMNANDICNSKCTMCNIWEQKQGFEMSPQHLAQVLEDDLYTEVKGVGITGGEPTLRKDLAELFEVCCQKLPSLKGLSIITNAIKEKEVIQRIEQVIEVCKRYNKDFSMMVSLDGYGEMHDRVRGRKGNFESALNVINHFRQNTDIPVAIGCTISKTNVWYVDELLDFMREENIYGRFRVAEYIKRLYNNDRGEVIRAFNEEEIYHLTCFFKKVEMTFEKNEMYRRTYRSIISILNGGKRLIGCPYQTNGVVLNSRAELHYCAPKSEKIGTGLKQSSISLYNQNLDERQRIINEHCQDCIHDYHAPITYEEKLQQYKEGFWNKLITINKIHRAPYFKLPLQALKGKLPGRKNSHKVLVTGWYGTETVGDKAILGQIIDYYKSRHDNLEFYVSSLYPFVTHKTLKELQVDAHVVPTSDIQFLLASAHCHETVMGGGPLMGINTLGVPLWAFKIASMFGRKTVVFGCGIGPLKKGVHIQAVKSILEMASEIKVRDNASLKAVRELVNRKEVENIGDPAKHYIQKLDSEIEIGEKKKVLACFLREWTQEYMGDLNEKEFIATRTAFEQNLAKYIRDLCAKHDLKPVFYPMHTFAVGNDDRDFNRRFVRQYLSDLDCSVHRYNTSVRFTVEAMKTSTINLCMRFHSVLFAHTLQTDFMAIDYTNGGKIKGYLTDHNALDRMISLRDLADKTITLA